MSENQPSAKSTVEGELSLDDLEKIAGGADMKLDIPPLDPFAGDVQVTKNTDSSYTSYFGAVGTAGNEAGLQGIPLNMTMHFP